MKLIFASNNQHKLSEVRAVLPDNITLLSLSDIDFTSDIPEPYDTFEENALTKAEAIYHVADTNVFSEDSGLVVRALEGRPGVFSARYAGEQKSDGDNLRKVLEEMAGTDDREAYYLSHICLIWNGVARHFEGRCYGTIALHPRGDGGFGYDPVFIPGGYEETFGQLDSRVKLQLSHRSKALNEMMRWLKGQI